jgi:hypothetical protein
MNDDPWLDDFKRLRAAMPRDDAQGSRDDSSIDHAACEQWNLDYFEQIVRGEWPVRIPHTLEIYAEGSVPRIRPLPAGQKRHSPASHIVTLVLEFDREKVREIMLESIRRLTDPARSKLPHIVWLTRVDRACFLETAAAHFADILAEAGDSLRRDPWLVEFLRELHDYDQDLVPEVVSETFRIDRAAGTRLRDIILDALGDAHVREHLGWLVAAAITERVQEQ